MTSEGNTMTKMSKKIDNAELIKSSFWISQIFIIVATVTGVYLAAQEGLAQAIVFESLHSKENNYYLRSSLDAEISDNIKTLEDYAEFLVKQNPYDLKPHNPKLAHFVWDTMKFSSATLETPSHLLSAARRFYNDSDDLIAKIEARQFGASHGAKLILELTTTMEQGGLLQLKQNHQQLAEELREVGILDSVEL